MTAPAGCAVAALGYASRNVPIFPCWGAIVGGCRCRKADCTNQGKHPVGHLVPRGVLDATTDPDTIRAWWAREPTANIGSPMTWATVLDVDPRHGGDEALAGLEKQHGRLPDTAEVLTGGGGRHVYFQPVPGLAPSNGKIGPGLDIKAGPGAYILLPPSSHFSGRDYVDELLHPLFETPLAPMPAWLVALASSSSSNGGGPDGTPDWAALLAGAPDGKRHAVAARIAGHFLGKRLPPTEVEQILLGFAVRCAPPFPAKEVREIVADLAAKDSRRATATATVWASAIPAPDFIQQADEVVPFLEPRLLVRGAITEVFAPRGLGKTQVSYAICLRLARTGLRVLLVDRDNPKHEVRRRLRAWGAADAPTFKVISRDQAPALTNAAAWQAFPLATYDVVMIDSIDAATEGVGEGDSAKPSKALAPVLDLARREDGPAILILGNAIKSGAHSRGCGIVEDRGDIVYEVRDATDLKPSGEKDWWHELPPAGVGSWADRASRRKRRPFYRLAFIASKFRLGEEPEPFVFEVDHRPTPWTVRDVTDEVQAAAEANLAEAIAERSARAEAAIQALRVEITERAAAGIDPLNKGDAGDFLRDKGMTQKDARAALDNGVERKLWALQRATGRGGGTWLVEPRQEPRSDKHPTPTTNFNDGETPGL